jgi:hypothetical protein
MVGVSGRTRSVFRLTMRLMRTRLSLKLASMQPMPTSRDIGIDAPSNAETQTGSSASRKHYFSDKRRYGPCGFQVSGYATNRDLGPRRLVVAAIVDPRIPLRFNRPLADRAAKIPLSFPSAWCVTSLIPDMIESVAKLRREKLKK